MPDAIYDKRLRDSAIGFFEGYSSYLTHACTFPVRQYVNGAEIPASQIWDNWEKFSKYLNRLIYGHAAKKHGKSLVILPTLEGELTRKNLHFHCAIGCTDRTYEFDDLKQIINKAWRNMQWTYNNPYIVPFRSNNWIEYMCKESVRIDLHSIDIVRCSIPAHSQLKH